MIIIIAYDNVAERREVFRESEASLKTNRGKRESPCFLCPIRFRLAETFRLRRKVSLFQRYNGYGITASYDIELRQKELHVQSYLFKTWKLSNHNELWFNNGTPTSSTNNQTNVD
jgi:hypothetical protein